MTKATEDFIHSSYQKALEQSHDILEILENLFKILNDSEVCKEDTEAYDAFIDALRGCLEIRKHTFILTNLISHFSLALMYSILWLISTQDMDYDVELSFQRKSIRSDLRKMLEKCDDNNDVSVNIKDRFRARVTFQNDLSEEEANRYIYTLYDSIKGIFAHKNRQMRTDFIEWFENNPKIPIFDKIHIRAVLEIPFYIDFVKDYIQNPKENNYRSFHFIMCVPMYSAAVPGGTQFEIQLRSKEMDKDAKTGSAAHPKYKEEQKFTNVFLVDDYSKINIPGFAGIAGNPVPYWDRDGIHNEKQILIRRISKHLLKEFF